MPRRQKGPRLYLRRARSDRSASAVWVIRDGQAEISTGCGESRLGDAEQQLAAYISGKWAPPAEDADRPGDPAGVFVAEVIALYLREKAPKAPDPSAVKARFKALLDWWGEDTLAEVKRSKCQAYVAHRETQPIASAKDPRTARRVSAQGARRELEDLSAAIGYWHGEHPLMRRPAVWLPEKPESPRDALTRDQAAALLKAAMGWRWKAGERRWERLSGSARANRAHVRRFILLGLYTGTRPGVMPKLLWHESPTQAWVDLERGTIYRRGSAERDHRTKRRPLVRVPGRLLAHLQRWSAADARREQPPASVLHHGGAPIDGRIRRAFASCVRDAGLPVEVTPHWMRHTCATWLMEGDASPWDAAGYTGMTVATLEKCYGHHRPGHQEGARRALSRGG